VGGEFAYLAGGTPNELRLAASYPQGRRGWVVAVKNLLQQPQGYVAAIDCVRAKAAFAYPGVTAVVTTSNQNGVASFCPATAPHALGAYFGPQSNADLGNTLLSDNGAVPEGKRQGAYATLDDVSNVPIGVFGGASCTSLHANGAQTPFKSVAPGVGAFWAFACPHKTPFAVGGLLFPKHSSDDGAIAPTESFSSQNGHKWFIALMNLSDHNVDYSAGARCIG
jgi:hypothetical protein